MKKQHVVALCTIAGVALFCGTKAFAADSDYAIYKPHSMLTTAYQEAWNDVNRASTESGSGDGKSADGGSSGDSSDGGSEGGDSSGGVNLKTAVGDISAGNSSSSGGGSKSGSSKKGSGSGVFADTGAGRALNNFFKGLGKWSKDNAERDLKNKTHSGGNK